MNFPKISLVIPSYNQGQYLEEAILSVINQHYPNLELFIIDGASKDDSVDIIRKYEEHLTWWISEKDKGQSEAINKGFTKAKGDIVGWLCSDDLFLPNALNNVAKNFIDLPETIGLIHGGVTLFNEKQELETRFTYLKPSIESYLSGMTFSQPGAFFKKKFLDKAGFLNNDLHFGMDYDLFMRLSLVCRFKPVKEILSKYRFHNESKSVAENNKFINDWKRSFVNLCKNLSWDQELKFLEATGLYDEEKEFYESFLFEPDKSILSEVNRQKALCFHLGHVLKDLYWTEKIDEAKKLMGLFQNQFSSDWFKDDQRLETVLNKLQLPLFAIKVFKKIKGFIK